MLKIKTRDSLYVQYKSQTTLHFINSRKSNMRKRQLNGTIFEIVFQGYFCALCRKHLGAGGLPIP